MNTRRISLLVLLLLMVALLLVGGCSRHYVEVYLNEECHPATADMDIIKPLLLFPGDYVVFINARVPPAQGVASWIQLDLPPGMFDDDDNMVKIEPGKRAILKVIAEGPMSGTIRTTGPRCPLGDPEVKIGEGP